MGLFCHPNFYAGSGQGRKLGSFLVFNESEQVCVLCSRWFLCVALSVLEFALQNRLALNSALNYCLLNDRDERCALPPPGQVCPLTWNSSCSIKGNVTLLRNCFLISFVPFHMRPASYLKCPGLFFFHSGFCMCIMGSWPWNPSLNPKFILSPAHLVTQHKVMSCFIRCWVFCQ